jgi:SpoVK/Ycf46/Vps4 family AAA+-type ATPase
MKKEKYKDIFDYASVKRLDYLINFMTANNFSNILIKDICDQITDYLTTPELKTLFDGALDKIKKVKIKLRREVKNLKEVLVEDGYPETIWEILRNNTESVNKYIFSKFIEKLTNLQKKYKNKNYSLRCHEKNTVEERIDTISKIFNLSKIEKDILLFEYFIICDNRICSLWEAIIENLKFSRDKKYTFIIHLLLGIDIIEAEEAICETSKLLSYGLTVPVTDKDISDDGSNMKIAPEIARYLSGKTKTPFSDMYFKKYENTTIPIEKHTVDKKDIEVLETIISHKVKDKGVNILLYGLPGTGKTEFSRSLGKHINKTVYEVKNLTDANENRGSFRYRALNNCQRMIDPEKSIVVIDEADELLNTKNSYISTNAMEKGQINNIFDTTKHILVWITNQSDEINESTMRRFNYSIEFSKLTHTQRKQIWKTCIENNNLIDVFSEENIEDFTTNYEINAGGVDLTLRNISKLKSSGVNKEIIIPIMESIMKAHVKVTNSDKSSADAKKPNAPSYSLEGLNIKADIPSTAKMLDRFNTIWIDPVETMPMRNMNILLYGPPGTGKTEFAKYVARILNRRLVIKQASDLLSCWVGETEKIIKSVFQEAEKDKAILFIDEADSMFGSREGATHSWEITQVNELLTNMETFHGMLICSTNFKKAVDSAAIRRFNIKLEFDYLTSQGAFKFYDIFLTKLIDSSLTEKDRIKLEVLEGLTPGDFKVVYQKYLLFDKSELSHDKLIDSLQQELVARDSKAGKTIGFSK